MNSYIRYSLRRGITRPVLELLGKVMPVATRGYDYCPILISSLLEFVPLYSATESERQVQQELTDQTTPIEPQHSTTENNFFFFSLLRLRNKVKNHSLVVASYDIVRNDGEFFR